MKRDNRQLVGSKENSGKRSSTSRNETHTHSQACMCGPTIDVPYGRTKNDIHRNCNTKAITK